MPMLLLPPRLTPDSEALQHAALALGWRVERLKNWRPPEQLRREDPVLYGEPLFADVVAGPLGLALLEPPADWLIRLPQKYLRRDVRMTTLAEARKQDQPAFMKPARDKCFPAGMYASGEALPENSVALPEDTPVLLAEPVEWEVEYRCFVLERAALTLSPYLRQGELALAPDGNWPASQEEIEEARRYIGSVLADLDVTLPPAVVLDVGRIARRGWAIVEANAAWGSGIYGCEPEQVLAVLRRATCKEEKVTPEERGWLRPLPEVER
ncbi:MAG TPA: ATP-grasp domain-containing protein [Ktedonobacterales bacterium]|jgi:hypothetical protein